MGIKVSVIVPVYNAAKTLAPCLGNLVHQTLSDIELILVNDASTDGSSAILSACEQQFPEKVILINLEENLGPGGARNVGLSYASGEYIGFVDSDDLADPTMFETLYSHGIENDYDMVDCAYYNQSTDSLILMTPDSCVGNLTDDKRSLLLSGGGYLWSRIFRRNLFDGIHFREHTILEDMEVMMQLFLRCQRLGTVKTPLYQYSATEDSASKLANPIKYHAAVTNAMQSVYDVTHNYPRYTDVQYAVEYSILQLYQYGLVNVLQPDSGLTSEQKENFLQTLRSLRKNFVKLPILKNPYVLEKFSKEDLELVLNIEKTTEF